MASRLLVYEALRPLVYAVLRLLVHEALRLLDTRQLLVSAFLGDF
jgi:hypothetical protein